MPIKPELDQNPSLYSGRNGWLCIQVVDATLLPANIITIYRPLRGDQIRLVHILPIDGQRFDSDDPVSCRLRTTTLGSAGEFFALSYVWGDPHETSQIFLNDEAFSVTVNLEHALRQVRNIIGESPIWIDALSINQNDQSERNKQVQKMHLIYGNAKTVIAWLGPGSDDCDLAIEKFDSLGEQLQESFSFMQIFLLGYSLLRHPAQSKCLMSHSNESDFPFDQTWALLQRPFWQRVWITQELYLAHSILFMCGQRSTSFDRFVAAYAYLYSFSHTTFRSPNDSYQIQWSLMMKSVYDTNILLLGSLLYHTYPTIHPLSHLLRAIRGRMYASDPRDMIYASLGIASDRSELNIEIEYHKTVSEVYMNATRALISQGDLDIISEAQEPTGTRQRELPSWVPDFSKPLAVRPFTREDSRELNFSASANKPMKVSWDSTADLRILSVSGVQVGPVDAFGRVWNKDLGASVEAIQAWLENLENLSERYKVQYEPDEAIWSTPIARSKAEESDPEILPAYLRLRRARGQANATDDSNALLTSTEQFREPMNSSAHMRRGFVAAGLLGLGPEAIQKGDMVCILFGAKVPYVLRKLTNGSYKMIGDAYVFGLMHDELKKGQGSAETFNLV